MNKCLNIGHRGARNKAPENTIASFRQALIDGADGFELDVQLTKDKVPLVVHDETLNRTAGVNRYVKDLSYKEIKNLDAGSWFSSKFRGQRFPTLYETLEFFAEDSIFINIELKNDRVDYPGLEEKVLDLLGNGYQRENIIISSKCLDSIAKIGSLRREVKVGLLLQNRIPFWLKEENDLVRTKNFFSLHPQEKLMSHLMPFAGNFHLIPWTVNHKKTMKRFIGQNCFGIITDYPEILSKCMLEIDL